MIHDSFARLLQSVFLANLRTRAQLHVRGTSQYSYTEYLQLLPNPTVAAAFRMDPLPGTCLLEMSQNIAYAVIDRVFGGTGADEQPQRALSEIEVGVMQRVFTDMLQPLAEAWRNVAELQPTLDKVETNPLFLQSLASSEVVAVITIGVEIGEHIQIRTSCDKTLKGFDDAHFSLPPAIPFAPLTISSLWTAFIRSNQNAPRCGSYGLDFAVS
jgi:flagellar motor switch protein FliM